MKVWITRYALSRGIFTVVGKVVDVGDGAPYFKVVSRGAPWVMHYQSHEWHSTYEAALKRAEEMRARRIVSLERSIKRLKSLRFRSA